MVRLAQMLHALKSIEHYKSILGFLFLFPLAAVASSGSSDAPHLRKNRRRWLPLLLIFSLLVAIIGISVWCKFFRQVDQHFDSMEAYFKSGSIGTEQSAGIPYWIWVTL